jgi:hypothetical protein
MFAIFHFAHDWLLIIMLEAKRLIYVSLQKKYLATFYAQRRF